MSTLNKFCQMCGTIAVLVAVPGLVSAQDRERGEAERAEREVREREGGQRGDRERQIAELQERLGQLERQVKELREAGKLDAAEDRIREFKQLQGKLAALRGGEERKEEGRGELPDEVREKLEQLKRRHAELREAGKLDEAAAVEREAKQLIEKFSPSAAKPERREGADHREVPAEVRERLERLKRRHAELREAGKLDEAAVVEREVKQLIERVNAAAQERERPEGGELAKRLEHLRAAVEHLRAAGLNDLAAQAAEQIGRFERELGQRREGQSPERREGEARERDGEKRDGAERREAGDRRDQE